MFDEQAIELSRCSRSKMRKTICFFIPMCHRIPLPEFPIPLLCAIGDGEQDWRDDVEHNISHPVCEHCGFETTFPEQVASRDGEQAIENYHSRNPDWSERQDACGGGGRKGVRSRLGRLDCLLASLVYLNGS